ncbi:hypothetical protein PP175_14035 [Aneurinibacillus sp. Ricciae_BoGa-3]|uniref:hypothetical protein n=1 Tax=Aneurinibacillus sp. Ricciae_BoGa-3 TaxID=3022697 RepID=UPI002340A7E7|nr:hypothetical protein [Aneurinibacillus sp. Ricciae_BoGa-3]WCK52558.1 hypothetical protein PP175_14035 [Aneurinibacillus sp. Ricciae_BoGa-3]
MEQEQIFIVEYECPLYGSVFYRNVSATNMEEACGQITAMQPDMMIRAVSLLPI